MACCLVYPPAPPPVPVFNPSQSFILDPTPSYSLFDPHPFSESYDFERFPPMYDWSGYEADSE